MKVNENILNGLVNKILNETIQEKAESIASKINSNLDEMENVCEQCGGKGTMMEGECSECGWGGMMDEETEEGIYDVSGKFPKHQEFDYVQEDEDEDEYNEKLDSEEDEFHLLGADDDGDPLDRVDRFCNTDSEDYNDEACQYHKSMMNENLKGGQKKLDKNKNNKIDAEDFKMLRKGRKETKEGKKFPDLTGDGEVTYADILKGRGVKMGKKSKVKESLRMTESEMVDFIEKIVKEEKLKSMGQTKGLNVYQKAHRGSGKENDDYLNLVAKKMKDYLKDGSKGEYDTNPEIFPKGNGELAKMDKKAYVPSNAVKDYTDNLTAAGQENLDYDEIHPNEDWVTDNVEGSSRTGNNPEWANTGKSDVNKKRNKIRKDNMLAKIKRKAYNKAPQPIVQDSGDQDDASKLMLKLESQNEKEKIKLNEEFEKMKRLLTYSKKTQ